MFSIGTIVKTFSLRTTATKGKKHQKKQQEQEQEQEQELEKEKEKEEQEQQIEQTERSIEDLKISAQAFTFREIAIATNNFSNDNLVGEGGFGRVYKGYIPGVEKLVAVKQLDRNGMQGNTEFLFEVSMISQVEHPNLVNLIGYCTDGDQRTLVYEYMEGGSLEGHLLDLPPGRKPLDWYIRMEIGLGAAKGLGHLHEINKPPVIYREFKTSNILLDEYFNPKLCDFGIARIGGVTGDEDNVSTRVMGTYGYCAPEYEMSGQLTTKSDVYSFGVVFLELISGRRAVDTTKPTAEQNLVTWAQPLFKDRNMFTQMADPLLDGNYPDKGLHQALAIAAMCLQEEASTRPLMSDVATTLEFLATPEKDLGSLKSLESILMRAMEEEAAEGDQEEAHNKDEKTEQEKGDDEEIQPGYTVESPRDDV